jgi:hypothetical protein
MTDIYLRAAMQAIARLHSPVELALERKADTIRFAFECAAITGTFPQLDKIPHYSQTPEVLEQQKPYEQNVDKLVGKAVREIKELQELEDELIFGRNI